MCKIVGPDISNEYAVQVLVMFASCSQYLRVHNESYSIVVTPGYIAMAVDSTIHVIMVEVTVVQKTIVTRQKLFGNLDQDCQQQLLTVWDKGHQ